MDFPRPPADEEEEEDYAATNSYRENVGYSDAFAYGEGYRTPPRNQFQREPEPVINFLSPDQYANASIPFYQWSDETIQQILDMNTDYREEDRVLLLPGERILRNEQRVMDTIVFTIMNRYINNPERFELFDADLLIEFINTLFDSNYVRGDTLRIVDERLRAIFAAPRVLVMDLPEPEYHFKRPSTFRRRGE